MQNNARYDISTQADGVRLVSYPPLLVSGLVASFRSQPNALWHVVDRYGQDDFLDSSSSCALSQITNGSAATVVIFNSVSQASNGIVSFATMALRGAANAVYTIQAACGVNDGIAPSPGNLIGGTFAVLIVECDAGWALNTMDTCTACKEAEYSPHGTACVACPAGAVCLTVQPDGSRLGSIEPAALPGYWLSHVDSLTLINVCPSLNAQRGACSPGTYLAGGICVADPARFTALQVYACTEGYLFYECLEPSACLGGETRENITLFGTDIACAFGYGSVLCDVCITDYHKNSDGTCTPCASGGLSMAAAKSLFLGLGAGVAALLVLVLAVITCGINEVGMTLRSAVAVIGSTALLRSYCERRRRNRIAQAQFAQRVALGADAARAEEREAAAARRETIMNSIAASVKEFASEKIKVRFWRARWSAVVSSCV